MLSVARLIEHRRPLIKISMKEAYITNEKHCNGANYLSFDSNGVASGVILVQFVS